MIPGSVLLRVATLLGALPLGVRRFLGISLGTLASYLPTRDREVARLQLSRFLGATAAPLVRKTYANFGRTLFESLALEPMLDENVVRRDDWPLMREVVARRRGVVVFTAHLGNWDLLGAYFVREGCPFTVIAREAQVPAHHELLAALRARYGIATVWRSDRQGLRQIVHGLRGKGVVAALIDQDTRVASMNIPFFGMPAKTPSSLALLAKKLNAVVVTAFIVREASGGYRAWIREVDDTLSPAEVLAEYNRRLEAIIRQYPDQWVWFHKRWRTTEEGITLSSAEYVKALAGGLGRVPSSPPSPS